MDTCTNEEDGIIEKRPRLLYLIGTYPGLTNTFIDREISILREVCGFDICTVSLRHPETLTAFSQQQLSLQEETLYIRPKHWLDFPFGRFLMANFYFIFRNPGRYFGTFVDLLRGQHPNLAARLKTVLHFFMGIYAAFILRKKDFNHIHVHFMDRAVTVAVIISRMLDKTYSFTAHAVDIYSKPVLMKLKMQEAQFVVTVSKFNRHHLQKNVPSLPKDKIHVLHPWVDPDKFSPSSSPQSREIPHILSVGRLVEKKGFANLIYACQLLRDRGVKFECRIVGNGPLHKKLESQISQLNLQEHVKLLGGQPQDSVFELLKNWADVFVLPCVIAANGDRDGIPVSLAEAMAMALPVISTDVVGISELVHSGAGILVQPNNPRDLSNALKKILGMSPEERASMGNRGRSVIEKDFDLKKGVLELAKLFFIRS